MLQQWAPGAVVDLNDALFGWRGSYVVVASKVQTELVKIKNLKTGSQQFVSPSRLRMGRLPQFSIASLKP
jgi:hypothetical protein